MDTSMETLTTAETAIAAGVTLPQVNRVIDEQILPETWYSTSPVRSFRADACRRSSLDRPVLCALGSG